MEKRYDVEAKLSFIDNLRGIAIILVILRHCFNESWSLSAPAESIARFSQMGVQLFFIVSAYTLCLSMERRSKDETGLRSYYLRRFFRIAPLFYFGIIFYIFYHSVLNPLIIGESPSLASHYTVSTVLANFLLVHDFYPGGALWVVAGGWSIGTETTFYLIFPFIYFLYRKYHRSNFAIILIPVAGLLLSIAVIAGLEYLATRVFSYENFDYFNKESGFLYYSIICQLPVFLLGMSLYYGVKRMNQFSNIEKASAAAAFIGLFVLSLLIFVYLDHIISILPFAAALSFLFLFILFKEVPALNTRLLARIGELSYSIYLFHFVFAWNAARFMPRLLGEYFSQELILIINLVISLVLTFFVARFSEKYIEKPGVRLGKRIIEKLNNWESGVKSRKSIVGSR